MTSLRGNLGSVDLANIFQMLSLNQREGTLHIFDGHSRKAIYFGRDGVSMLTRGRGKPDSLGRILVRFDKITPDQLRDALRAQQDAGDRLLGQVLVEHGIVTRNDVEEALRTQIEEEVYSLFIWKDAQFEFVEGPPDEEIQSGDGVARLTFSVNSLIMEAAKRVDEWEWIQRVIASTDEIFRYTGKNVGLDDEIFARTWAGKVLAAVDGRRSVDEVVDVSCVNRFEVTKMLALLVEGGAIEKLPVPELRLAAEQSLTAGDTAQSVKFLSRLVALKADTPDMHRQLAEGFEGQRQLARAAFHYRVHAEILADSGAPQKAFEVYLRICDLLPTDLAAADRMTELFAAHPDGIEQHAQCVIDHGKRLADVLGELGRQSRAIQVLQRVVSLAPDDHDLRGRLIQAYLHAGMPGEAVAEYDALAETALAVRDFEQAERVFRKILQIDRNREETKTRLNQLLSRRKLRERGLRIGVGLVVLLVVGSVGAWQAWSWYDGERQAVVAETTAFGLGLGELRTSHAPLQDDLEKTIRGMSTAYGDPASIARELKDGAATRKSLIDRANIAAQAYHALAGAHPRAPDSSAALDAVHGLERSVKDLRLQEDKLREALTRTVEAMCDRLEPFPPALPLAEQARILREVVSLGEAVPQWLGSERGVHAQGYHRNVSQTLEAFDAMRKDAAELAVRGDLAAEQERVVGFLTRYLPPRDVLEQISVPRSLTTRPSGAHVLVNDEDTGLVTPAVVRLPLLRKSTVRLAKDGFQESSVEFEPVDQIDHNRAAEQLRLANECVLVKDLAFRTPALPSKIVASPVLVGDRIYVATKGSEAAAFDLTGAPKGTFSTRSGGGVQARPLVFDDLIVFAAYDGFLYPYRPSVPQEPLPREALPGKLQSDAAQWGNFGIFADVDGHVTAYEARGRSFVQRWQYPRSGPGRTRGFLHTPLVDGNDVVVVSGDGTIAVLDAATGAERRSIAVREGSVAVALSTGLVSCDGLWIGVSRGESKQSRVLLIDRETHQVRSSWTVDGAVRWTPLVWQGVVYAVSDDGDVTSLRLAGGAFQGARTFPLGPGVRVSAEPALDAGVLYVGDSSGTLSALDVRGSQVERLYDFRIPGTERKPVPVTTRPAVHGDWVLFGAGDNSVYGLRR